MIHPPPGFVLRRGPGRLWVLRSDHEDDLLAAGLGEPRRLAADLPRGAVERVDLRSGPAVVRPYRRGGLLGALGLPHRSARRFLGELETTLEARRRGLPVPEPLGLAAVRAGVGWRGWAVFREIAGKDLRRALPETGAAGAEEILRRALALVRRAHDEGLSHPDLNLGNLLLEDGARRRVWILDLDRARFGESRSPLERFAEVSRLDRSFEKHFGEKLLDRGARDELMVTYAEGRPELERLFRARLPIHARTLRRHALLWGSRRGRAVAR